MSVSVASPPSYSVSPPHLPTPHYSSSPLQGEQTIQLTPRGNTLSAVSENVIKSCSFLTLIFKEQSNADTLPTYGSGSTIHGEIELKNIASVLNVEMKLKGRLYASISGAGPISVVVVSERTVVWSQDESHSQFCPSVLPFAIRFPRTYTHDNHTRHIPPSFYQSFFSNQFYPPASVSVRCSYWLKVTIHNGGGKMAFWKPSKSYTVPLNYLPKSRPQRPISHLDRFLTSFKDIPEDWLQIESVMRVRDENADVNPISCRFFIPSVGAFGLSDTIPFHIQLSSSLPSLRLLLAESPKIKQPPSVRAFITRHTIVETQTRRCWKATTLGEGVLRPVAPSADATFSDDEEVYVDWEGEVRCDKDVVYGGFNTGSVIVKDYIAFAFLPPNPRTCPLLGHQYCHPIRLVTSVWTEDYTVHPSEMNRVVV